MYTRPSLFPYSGWLRQRCGPVGTRLPDGVIPVLLSGKGATHEWIPPSGNKYPIAFQKTIS